MTQASQRYRPLPGHRRGILRGASVWMAGDHLLSVKSYRVREEYKRFQFRDVQAIVVAQCPRFQISTRSLLLALIWLSAFGLSSSTQGRQLLPEWDNTAMWLIAAALVCAWFYISFARSCRCRLLTAVSNDELPSVYRTWTARRFLAQVEPRIAEVQGRLVGNWFEAVDAYTIGPPGAPAEPASAPPRPAARSRAFWSTLFVALLFVNSVTMLGTLHSPVAVVLWLASLLVLAEVVATVGVFLQHHRGIVRPGMKWLAIAAIVKIGLVFYVAILMMSAASAATQGMNRSVLFESSTYVLLRQIDAWVSLALGLVGVALLLRSEYSE
ncbi:MAG TPA: hypothetical protein VNY05_29825 [Candidatus Acidoferrales bacterium]|nr:hypothetical protein [Candidatus Acidoferrales bacterium]